MTEQAERKDLEAAAKALGLSPEDLAPADGDQIAATEGAEAVEVVDAVESAGALDAPDAAVESEDDGTRWYVVHTYSGYERKVQESLEERIRTLGLEREIGDVLIPTEDVVEMKGGKKVVTSKKFFPGYLLVRMLMNDTLWHLIKNTPRVTGFVGEGREPIPLTDDEVNKILNRMEESVEAPKPKFQFGKGEVVRITDGPFTNFSGKVEEVDMRRSTLKVMVSIFGRATPVELDFFQVEKT